MMKRATVSSATRAFVLVCLLSIHPFSVGINIHFFKQKNGALLELILQLLASRGAEADALVLKEEDDTALGSSDKFLSSRLRYTTDAQGEDICLLQSGDIEIGVMMGWERGISAFRFVFSRSCTLHSQGGSNLKCKKRCVGYATTIPTLGQA
jgi:hypothetical protein